MYTQLEHGADALVRDTRGRTAMHMLTAQHRFWLVDALVVAGVQVDVRDASNRYACSVYACM